MNFGKPINITVHFGSVQSSGGGVAITIDSALSSTSTNPVQNKVITEEIGNIQDALVIINETLHKL